METRKYPTRAAARRDILDIGRRMYQRGFVAANDGNISVRTGENEIWATPTAVSKGFMTEDMLVRLDLDGSILSGGKMASSEIKMHLRIYRENPDIISVSHAHPPAATTFAVAGIPLDRAILQEAVVQLGVVPLAPYALPGSDALAESVAPYCRAYNGLLLEHHGAVAWGESAMRAFHRLESIEYYATVMMNLRILGAERLLDEKQIDELIALRPDWGITGGGRPIGG